MTTPIRSLLALVLAAALPGNAPQDAAPAPGVEVARLAAFAGLWDVQSVVSGFEPVSGLAKLVMLGDRWLIEESRFGSGDQTIDGRAFTGWDPNKQRYVRASVSTADSRLQVVDLTWDDSKQALISDAQTMDFGSGPVSVRGETRMPDSYTIVFTATPVAPDALPALTVTYSRNR
jgi:hypothetical protein